MRLSQRQLTNFLSKIRFVKDSCWFWTGAIGKHPKRGGYGVLTLKHKGYRAHCVSYELFVGPIPDGLELDHKCRIRKCVNPYHLEPVTHAENMRRAKCLITHCPSGHKYTEANTYLHPRPYDKDIKTRRCRKCKRVSMKKYRRKKKLSEVNR